MNDELSRLVHTEAVKTGVSTKQANKALQQLRSGKINISQVAPQIKTMLMQKLSNNSTDTKQDLKSRLAAKRQALSEARQSKFAKQTAYNKTKNMMETRKELEKLDKEQREREAAELKKEYEQSIDLLEKRIGRISDDLYNTCLQKVNSGQFRDDTHKKNCQQMIDLYHRQQEFTDVITDFANDEDISDLEEEEI